MSKNPILPRSDAPEDSYDQRLRINVERKLQSLDAKQVLSYQGRLGGRYSATAAPTGGAYQKGDLVWNSNPAEAGVALSKYVVIGWICTVTGTPGTWLDMRTLTGN